MEDLRNKLLAQGIDATLVDSMLKSMSTKKPAKKAAPKKNAFFSGHARSRKVDKTITAYTVCQCCGSIKEQQIVIKATSEDSPDTQKLVCAVCENCPAYLRKFTHEELVTMLLLGEKPNQELRGASVAFRARLAGMLTPEAAVTFTSLSAMKHEEEKCTP